VARQRAISADRVLNQQLSLLLRGEALHGAVGYAVGSLTGRPRWVWRKRAPIVGRQLSEPEELREAKLGFDRGYGGARPVCNLIPPELEDVGGGHDKLRGQPLTQAVGHPIGNLLPTVGAAIFLQYLRFIAGHLCNSNGEQNGFGGGASHDAARQVIRCSVVTRCLFRTLCEALAKAADEQLEHLTKPARIAGRVLSGGLDPTAAKFGEAEAVALKAVPE
jgi:hypothetical protein